MDLTDKSQLIKYLKQNNLWAKKGLSQNFLVDRTVLDMIVETAELKPEDLVIEVGPGTGILTFELTKWANGVIAIEKDEKLTQLLNCYIAKLLSKQKSNSTIQQFSNTKLKIINADILKVNLSDIIGNKKYKVVANIPYHITSKILELFLSREHKPELMVLLVQKEVAERVCASPGEMSVLSVSVQLYGKPEIVDIVKANSFFPAPKVDSAILRIEPRVESQGSRINEKAFFRLVHIGFAARRKTLLNNLMSGYRLDREKVIGILKEVGLTENTRAQELSVEEWKELAEEINHC